MLKLKVEFVLLLMPYFAGWKAGIQYDFMPIPIQISTSDKVLFFFLRKTANLSWKGGSICLYTLREMPVTDTHMRDSAIEGLVSLRLRLGCTWQRTSTS